MTKRLWALGLLALVLVAGAATAAHAGTRPAPRAVVLVLAPYLRWEDVLSGYMPETSRLAEAGAVANMNVRSLLPEAGEPSAEAGALMISAGTWARHVASAAAPVETSGTPAIAFPGLAAEQRANAGEDADIRLGSLGQAVVDAGGVTAAIGNGDGGGQLSRPAALVAMDARGNVARGDVSLRMVRSSGSSDAALGVISDGTAIVRTLSDVLPPRGADARPTLVVVDPGDLDRAHRAAGGRPEDLERLDRLGAIRELDTIVGAIRSEIPRDAVLIVAAPVAAQVRGEPSGFGPLLVSDAGGGGLLGSSSTHRMGIVTSADLTAGILDFLGMRAPVQVAGAPLRRQAVDRGEIRLLTLQRADEFMRAVDAVRPAVVNGFILAVTLVLGACLLIAGLPGLPVAVARNAQIALLALASVPAASVLMYAPLALPPTPLLVVGMFLGTLLVLLTFAVVTHHTSARPRALSLLALLAGVAILVDQWLGAPLSLDGLFSYSPLVGARFYGIGNEMAALLVGGVLTGLAVLFDTYPAHHRWMPQVRRWGVPIVGAVCVLTAAAPFLGANIGVMVWGVFAFVLAWWGMTGRKLTWRPVAVVLLAIVLLVAAFGAIDLFGGGEPTHLGRSIVTAARGGAEQLATIVARKAATNVRVLFSTSWSLLFLALAAALAYVRWRPRGMFRDILMERPNFAATLSAVMIAGVIAYFTEDSGIVVPALLLLFPTIAVVHLILWRRVSGGDAR